MHTYLQSQNKISREKYLHRIVIEETCMISHQQHISYSYLKVEMVLKHNINTANKYLVFIYYIFI